MLTKIGSRTDAATNFTTSTDKLIYIGPRREFAECLIQAVEMHFTDIEIVRVDGIEGMLGNDAPPADQLRLALVHDRMVKTCLADRESLQARYPELDVAIVCTGQPADKANMSRLLQCDRVKGLLPFNLPLDVWLSALQLMLSGGEYVPREYIDLVQPTEPQMSKPVPSANGAQTGVLTRREQDVIALVAQGLQNKVIAARLNLSEHTIKLHIHHIISKLGVHNRTQAAAIYFGQAGQ